MTDNFKQLTATNLQDSISQPEKRRRGGRKKIDPELKKQHQKENRQRYIQGKRIWQAYTTDEVMDKTDSLMRRMAFKTKHELLVWLIGQKEQKLNRKG